MIGAAAPMVSREGTNAMTNEHAAISETLTVSAARRPRRSAKRPKNQEPSGRVRNVIAKTAYTYTVEFGSSPKNCASK